MSLKTYLPGLTIIVKHLCRFLTRYNKQINEHINASSLSPEEKLVFTNWVTSSATVCEFLRGLTGY